MNTCVKTGFLFLDTADMKVRTGDLFCLGGLLNIRGIPTGTERELTEQHCHARVDNVIYQKRVGSEYTDTAGGVEIVTCSPAFREHITQYYPDLTWILPEAP